jgi:uncharacterized membrane protein
MFTTDMPWLGHFFRLAVIILEVAGTITILLGAAIASASFVQRALGQRQGKAYEAFRSGLGRSILLGLEFLVAGDIVKSLVINPNVQDLLVLAGLVLVRTFLSISLGVEINGHWPWQDTMMARQKKCDQASALSSDNNSPTSKT